MGRHPARSRPTMYAPVLKSDIPAGVRDMLISPLQEVVMALGGELRLSAVFPDGVVEINQFPGRIIPRLTPGWVPAPQAHGSAHVLAQYSL